MGVAAGIARRARRARTAWLTPAALEARIARRRGVLTLCYHALDGALEDYPYRTAPAALGAQLDLLGALFEIVPLARAVARLRDGTAAAGDRPLAAITFDDGYRCVAALAAPALERRGLHATLFAPRDLIRRPGPTYLSEEALAALAARPLWDVGGHGITHSVLTGLLPADQAAEVDGSADWLDGLLGPAPRGFAYPQGQVGASVVAAARARFDHGLATDRRVGAAPDLHQIRRFCPDRSHDDPRAFARALLEAPMEGGDA